MLMTEHEEELPEGVKTIKIELYYDEDGLGYWGYHFEAPERLEWRNISFLLVNMMGDWVNDQMREDDAEPAVPDMP